MTDTIKKPKYVKSVEEAIWVDMRKTSIDLGVTMGIYIEMLHGKYKEELMRLKRGTGPF